VPDFALLPHSGLEHLVVPGSHGARTDQPGVTVVLRTDLALAMVMARNGKAEDLRQRVQDRFGLTLPMAAQRTEQGGDLNQDGLSFIWAGPGRWLAAMDLGRSRQPAAMLEPTLRDALSGLASVTSQTDGRCVFRLSGPNARDVLAKGIPIDIDPRAFRPGDTALTLVGHIAVHFWQIDLSPAFELAVPRSFAASFCEWLFAASAQYGLSIAPA
jgi:methylglutamate dehydrogenase subunit D